MSIRDGSFWTSSKRTPIKALDGKIQKTIQTRLNRLEETADIEDYKKLIFSRKEGILSRIITEELDLLYKNMYSENSPDLDKIYIQIFDRKNKISELLENFEDNMNYLDAYIKQELSPKSLQLHH